MIVKACATVPRILMLGLAVLWIIGCPAGTGSGGGEICGNGTCGSGENPTNCPGDCGGSGGGAGEVCGNGTCGSGENPTNCPGDCGGSGGGGAGEVCGNGTCGSGENVSNCPSDCGDTSGDWSAPAAPVFPDPGDGQTNVRLQTDARGEPSIIELDWWAPATATGYGVEISRNSSFSGSSTETWGTSSSDLTFVILSSEYRYETTYYWRVEAYNDSGSTFGSVWSFRTQPGPSGGGGSPDPCGDNPFFAEDRVQADAGPNLTIDPGICISLTGRITEGHPPFTVRWTSPGMSFASGETKVIACPPETATFTFTVLDSCGVQDMDTMTVSVRARPRDECPTSICAKDTAIADRWEGLGADILLHSPGCELDEMACYEVEIGGTTCTYLAQGCGPRCENGACAD